MSRAPVETRLLAWRFGKPAVAACCVSGRFLLSARGCVRHDKIWKQNLETQCNLGAKSESEAWGAFQPRTESVNRFWGLTGGLRGIKCRAYPSSNFCSTQSIQSYSSNVCGGLFQLRLWSAQKLSRARVTCNSKYSSAQAILCYFIASHVVITAIRYTSGLSGSDCGYCISRPAFQDATSNHQATTSRMGTSEEYYFIPSYQTLLARSG
jgi:hypothetical protein